MKHWILISISLILLLNLACYQPVKGNIANPDVIVIDEGRGLFLKDNYVFYTKNDKIYYYEIGSKRVTNTKINGSPIDFEYPYLVALRDEPTSGYVYYNVGSGNIVNAHVNNRYSGGNCISNGKITFSGVSSEDNIIESKKSYFNEVILYPHNPNYNTHVGFYNTQTKQVEYIGYGHRPIILNDIIIWPFQNIICYYNTSNGKGDWFNVTSVSSYDIRLDRFHIIDTSILYELRANEIRLYDMDTGHDILVATNSTIVDTYGDLALYYNYSTERFILYNVSDNSISFCNNLSGTVWNTDYWDNLIVTNDRYMAGIGFEPIKHNKVMIYDVENDTLTQTDVLGQISDWSYSFDGTYLLIATYEENADDDLNLDGDKEDTIIRLVILDETIIIRQPKQPLNLTMISTLAIIICVGLSAGYYIYRKRIGSND